MARDPWEPRWDPEIFEGFRTDALRPCDYPTGRADMDDDAEDDTNDSQTD